MPVGDGHEICVRSFGTPGGVPAVFLHGGPGSGVNESHLGIFDPAACHVVAFDQRGAGLSRPKPGFDGNTTPALIADATRNAHDRATEFARSGEASVGTMRSASQGAFYILPARGSSGDDEYGGTYDKSTIDKLARVVVTVEYALTQ